MSIKDTISPTIQIPIKKKIQPIIEEKKAEPIIEEKPIAKATRTKSKKIEEPVVKINTNDVVVDTKPMQYHEISLGLIDLHPQIAKLSQFGTVVYLDLFTTGSTNSSRFEPARSVTVTGKENIQKLADALNQFLATV